jgi:type III secretion protein J
MQQTTFGRRVGAAATGMLILACAACSSRQELYSKLSERQANEMVAVLRSAGIEAEKQGKDGTFSIQTKRDDFPAAVRALAAQGYPRETYDTMGTVFKREGFVSSPLEERARLVHAMSQEISNTLASIDGVVQARVHLVMPERHPLADKATPSAASVFIKHRPDKDMTAQVAQIKALVVNSIEGLPYDNVTVALFPAEELSAPRPAQAAPAPVPAAGASATTAGLPLPLMAGTVGGVLLLGGGGMLWLRRRDTAGKPDSSATPARPALPTPEMTQERLQAMLRRAAEKAQ